MKVSIVISARNEWPQIMFTCNSILADLGSFLSPKDFEIIIVNNCSDDEKYPKRAEGGTTDFISVRGAFHNGIIKILYDPIAGNVSARNKGAKIAQGEYLFFSDAHMTYDPGCFKRMIETIDESGGIVHPAYSWMGAYPPAREGTQYSWKLGEEFKGTWNNYVAGDGKNWFYIPASGHCILGMKRKQFLDFGGYPDYLRCYGGGEVYLDSVWWMLGSNSVSEPRAHAYHLSAGRGYSYVHLDYVHNIFHSAITLGADLWAERTYLNYLRKVRKETLDQLWQEAEQEAQIKRNFVKEKSVMSFNDMIVNRPWDIKNMERLGSSNSGLLIYQDTWINMIKGTEVEVLYNQSEKQKQLAELIETKLKQFVYKSKKG
ncbi:MAG: glycosyltransferase family A protein [Nanoarchaeota archaeon]